MSTDGPNASPDGFQEGLSRLQPFTSSAIPVGPGTVLGPRRGRPTRGRAAGLRRRLLVCGVLILLTGFLLGSLFLAFVWRKPTLPDLGEHAIIDVEVLLIPLQPRDQVPGPFSTSDPEVIGQVLSVLDERELTEEHKCGDVAHLVLRTRGGGLRQLRLLPGHNVAFYEYREGNSIFRIDRERFLAAVERFCGQALPLRP